MLKLTDTNKNTNKKQKYPLFLIFFCLYGHVDVINMSAVSCR